MSYSGRRIHSFIDDKDRVWRSDSVTVLEIRTSESGAEWISVLQIPTFNEIHRFNPRYVKAITFPQC